MNKFFATRPEAWAYVANELHRVRPDDTELRVRAANPDIVSPCWAPDEAVYFEVNYKFLVDLMCQP